jgi:hypothetical protein
MNAAAEQFFRPRRDRFLQSHVPHFHMYLSLSCPEVPPFSRPARKARGILRSLQGSSSRGSHGSIPSRERPLSRSCVRMGPLVRAASRCREAEPALQRRPSTDSTEVPRVSNEGDSSSPSRRGRISERGAKIPSSARESGTAASPILLASGNCLPLHLRVTVSTAVTRPRRPAVRSSP